MKATSQFTLISLRLNKAAIPSSPYGEEGFFSENSVVEKDNYVGVSFLKALKYKRRGECKYEVQICI